MSKMSNAFLGFLQGRINIFEEVVHINQFVFQFNVFRISIHRLKYFTISSTRGHVILYIVMWHLLSRCYSNCCCIYSKRVRAMFCCLQNGVLFMSLCAMKHITGQRHDLLYAAKFQTFLLTPLLNWVSNKSINVTNLITPTKRVIYRSSVI